MKKIPSIVFVLDLHVLTKPTSFKGRGWLRVNRREWKRGGFFFANNSAYSSRYFTVTCDNNTINPHKLLPIVLPHLQGEGGGATTSEVVTCLEKQLHGTVKAPNSRQGYKGNYQNQELWQWVYFDWVWGRGCNLLLLFLISLDVL